MHAGAAREFPRPFVDDYLRMVRACAEHDRDEIIQRSTRMGFLTGEHCTRHVQLHGMQGSPCLLTSEGPETG